MASFAFSRSVGPVRTPRVRTTTVPSSSEHRRLLAAVQPDHVRTRSRRLRLCSIGPCTDLRAHIMILKRRAREQIEGTGSSDGSTSYRVVSAPGPLLVGAGDVGPDHDRGPVGGPA